MKSQRALALMFCASLGAFAQEKKTEITPDPLTATILERIVYDKRQVCLMAGVVRETTRAIFACSHEGAATELQRDSIFELARPIGAEPAYSNLGFLWLADILARRGGKPYDELLLQRILIPLGMLDTGARLTDAQAKRRVVGHDRAYKPVPPLDFPPALAAAAGLTASMDDLLRLAEALAGRRKTPLDETLALAMSPLHVMGGVSRMGYAWFLSQQANGRIVFHNGQTVGAYAAIAVNTATRSAAVVVADAPVDFDDLAVHLVDPKGPLKKLPR